MTFLMIQGCLHNTTIFPVSLALHTEVHRQLDAPLLLARYLGLCGPKVGMVLAEVQYYS